MDLSMSSTMGLTNPSASWAAPARTRRSMGAVRLLRSLPAPLPAQALLLPLHAGACAAGGCPQRRAPARPPYTRARAAAPRSPRARPVRAPLL